MERLFSLVGFLGASITTILFLVVKGRVNFFANGTFLIHTNHQQYLQKGNAAK